MFGNATGPKAAKTDNQFTLKQKGTLTFSKKASPILHLYISLIFKQSSTLANSTE